MSADFIERFRVEASDIAAEHDPAVLLGWRVELVRVIKEISFQLDAFSEGPFVDRRWLGRAHYARRANYERLYDVCRRLSALGAMPKSPSLADAAAEAHGLRLEVESHLRTIADLRNQLAQAKEQKVARAEKASPPALWEKQRDNYEKKIANLQQSLTASIESKKAEKMQFANQRQESVAQQFVALMKERLPADEFLSLIAAAEVAATAQRAA